MNSTPVTVTFVSMRKGKLWYALGKAEGIDKVFLPFDTRQENGKPSKFLVSEGMEVYALLEPGSDESMKAIAWGPGEELDPLAEVRPKAIATQAPRSQKAYNAFKDEWRPRTQDKPAKDSQAENVVRNGDTRRFQIWITSPAWTKPRQHWHGSLEHLVRYINEKHTPAAEHVVRVRVGDAWVHCEPKSLCAALRKSGVRKVEFMEAAA